jgi:3-dehydroquinate synthase
METLTIEGAAGRSTLLVGERLDQAVAYLPASPVFIITDPIVRRLYGNRFPDRPVIEMGVGESLKTLDTVAQIYSGLIAHEADRSAFLLGIGGGIVCDVAGFVASTYLRGIRFGFVPTTLLAQVDASVGGKNGVNFSGYKNMVGVFNQPEFVICDPDVLTTLSDGDRGCGLAEIVKHGAIADADLFAYLEENIDAVLALEPAAVHRMVYDSVVIKSTIVNRDEKESGERRKLNFGHTFGHAVEKVRKIPHGEAVSIGMMAAAALSVHRGYLPQSEAARLERLLERLGLPTRLAVDREKALDALKHDKKREGDAIHFVLLKRIGEAVVERVGLAELAAVV